MILRGFLLFFLLCGPVSMAAAATPTSAAAPAITVIAVGDLMLTDSADPVVRREGDFDFAFGGTASLLQEGDVVFANLETPLTRSGDKFPDKTFNFRQDPGSAAAIKRAGINVVSLANNHMMDYSARGLLDTIAALDKEGVAYAGAGPNLRAARKPALLKVKGVTVAVLAYALTFPTEFHTTGAQPGTVFGHAHFLREDIPKARREADLVLVSFHWGAELMPSPKDYQKELARAAVGAGADAVLGHHPHVIQPVEYVEGKPVFYSLGNFAFGSYAPKTITAIAARIKFQGGRLMSVEAVPLDVNNRVVQFNPRVAKGKAAQAIHEELVRKSSGFAARFEFADGVTRILPVSQPGQGRTAPRAD
ncbi:MAG: hypothetical protein GMKNLPBB_01144 [Myxococcota bacterium]|nr:hypothetical protein [Myxococcota bacterium]